MQKLTKYIQDVAQSKKIGLMTHVVVGYPTLQETTQIVDQMVNADVDLIELQIPFSDPLADGPTIMEANDVALENGVTLQDCFAVMKQLSAKYSIPLLFMGYYQSVYHRGVEEFCRQAKESGAAGLIIPDIPLDEESHEGFIAACEKYELHHVRLLSPTSSEERIRLNAKVQNGFVYCTSRSGTTGADQQLDPEVVQYLRKVRKHIQVPLAVGFGISKPEHVKALIGHAEVAVVGSAVIEMIKQKGLSTIEPFLKSLRPN